MSKPTTLAFPSLYARLYPADVEGHRGYMVRCTATATTLGYIWWTVAGTTIAWHWCIDANHGERTTQRAAVQALRDIANLGAASNEPAPAVRITRRRIIGDVWNDAAPTAPAKPAAPQPKPAPVAPPPPSIVWDDAAPAFDLVTFAANLAKHGRK